MHLRSKHLTIFTISFLLAAECLAHPTAPKKRDISPSAPSGLKTKLPPGYSIPTVDISGETHRQMIVDREAGQYLGHPTTVLLEDGKTMLIVYPKGHGRGAIVYKRSTDGGRPGATACRRPSRGRLRSKCPRCIASSMRRARSGSSCSAASIRFAWP